MYAPFFGLQQEAFSIAPDPRFLHLSTIHREALAHLLYGLQGGGGFVLLTGEIGTGKTTVCRCFLEQIPPGHRVAYLYNPKLTPVELLQTVCQEFGIELTSPAPTTVKPCIDALNHFLLDAHAQGQQCLLVVDEAQGLSTRLLELLRLLTNLETSERKLLQIVLIGQPELRRMLARPQLEQLAQRVIARVHLGPLNAEQTANYVQHRLAVAGLVGEAPFDRRALALVHRLSGGVPRRINLLCQRALLGAYARGTRQVGPAIVRQAAREVTGELPPPRRRWAWAGVAGALLLGAGVAAAWWWQPMRNGAVVDAAVGAGVDAGSAAAGVARPGAGASMPVAMSVEASTSAAVFSTAPPQAYADEQSAGSALAAIWSLQPGLILEVCVAARTLGLACHEGQGDLALLRRLQRPALLQLQSGGQVLLLGLSADAALISGATGEQHVPLAALQAAWTGAFNTVWRPPPGWLPAANRSGSNEVAAWVLDRLVALQGEARGGSARASRDEALRQRVFAFQVSQGLALDGLAGPITLMQLNRASGIDEPRLRALPP